VARTRPLDLLQLPLLALRLVRTDLREPNPLLVLVEVGQVVLARWRTTSIETSLLNECTTAFVRFVVASDSGEAFPLVLFVLSRTGSCFVFVFEYFSSNSESFILEELPFVSLECPILLSGVVVGCRDECFAFGVCIYEAWNF